MDKKFAHNENQQMIWNLLKDNYGEARLQPFQDKFRHIMNQIIQHSSNFSNLIEMNKTFVFECSKQLVKKKPDNKRKDELGIERMREAPPPPRTNINQVFNEKQEEFKKMIEKESPAQIDFADKDDHQLQGKLGDIMAQHVNERNDDMRNITQKYNRRDAQDWINNEVPPSLTIDHNKSAKVQINKVISQKHVTFADNIVTPKVSFLDKIKKKIPERDLKQNYSLPEPNIKIETQSLSPDKIENHIFYFNNINKNIKRFYISKLFTHNIVLTTVNKLQQEISKPLSDEIFILGQVNINSKVNRGKILFVKKYNNDKDVIYESDERISVPSTITNLEIIFLNRNHDPLIISPLLSIEHFFKGSVLNIISDDQSNFIENQYCYLILKKDLLLPGEKILINDDLVFVVGTCKVSLKTNSYHLDDIDMGNMKEHNCSIIDWSNGQLGKNPKIYRAPTFHFMITS